MLNYLKTYVEILSEYKIEFLIGLGTTLLIAAISLFFAVLIGIGVGYINFVPTKKKNFNFYLIKTLQWIGKEYIDLIRASDILLFWSCSDYK